MSTLVGLTLTGTQWDNTGLYIERNPLNYVSLNTHLPAMQAKGIGVKFDPRTYPALDIISGTGQQATGGETLGKSLCRGGNRCSNGTPDARCPCHFYRYARQRRTEHTITATTDANGRAETTFTLGADPGKHSVRATAASLNSSVPFIAITTASAPTAQLDADVNGDGVVNIQDLVVVSSRLGQTGQNVADVNGDGAVNIQDLVLVAGELGTEAAAPSAWQRTSGSMPSRTTVEQWLTQARHLSLTDVRSQRGVLLLERLLAALAPKETVLVGKLPNPFQPRDVDPVSVSKTSGGDSSAFIL